MITFLQILLIFFALFAISRALLRMRENKLSKKEFFFWTALWIAVIIVSLQPAISMWVSNLFGIARGVDLLVYVSIITLFYLMFRLYVKIDDTEQEVTKLVRIIALKGEKFKKEKNQ